MCWCMKVSMEEGKEGVKDDLISSWPVRRKEVRQDTAWLLQSGRNRVTCRRCWYRAAAGECEVHT